MGTSNLLKNDASYINEKMCLLNVLNLQSNPALISIHLSFKFKTAKLFPKDDVDCILMRNVQSM